MNRALRWATAAALAASLAACAGVPGAGIGGKDPFTLTILHVGDTHSRLEPAEVRLRVDIDGGLRGRSVTAELGGFPQLLSAVRAARATEANALFVHSGDLFQGSLYFTRYRGTADTDFWNLMGLDAAVLGNHEFDKGPALLQASLLGRARFAVVSANVDAAAEPAIDAALIRPGVIVDIGGQRVGIVGVTTEDTPFISSPGPGIRFLDAAASVQAEVDALRGKGVDKIVLLSHQGYGRDLQLAGLVAGVDVIVGGHSHTLLGDFDRIGLAAGGRYPSVTGGSDGGKTLVAHAWEWGKVLGTLAVTFDDAGGVASWRGRPRAVIGRRLFRIADVPDLNGESREIEVVRDGSGALSVAEARAGAYDPVGGDQRAAYLRVYDALLHRLAAEPGVALVDPDPEGARMLASLAPGVAEARARVVARAAEDMPRGLNRGPGPLVADSMASKAGVPIALNNPGGVRTGLSQGPISVAAVYELLPFGNTLVTLTLRGSELVRALEEAVDFQVSRYGPDPRAPYVYASGIAFVLDLGRPGGERVREVRVRASGGAYAPIDPQAQYRVVVNSFMAAGGDRYDTLKAAAVRYDTGFGDAEAFLEYIEGRALANDREERVRVAR